MWWSNLIQLFSVQIRTLPHCMLDSWTLGNWGSKPCTQIGLQTSLTLWQLHFLKLLIHTEQIIHNADLDLMNFQHVPVRSHKQETDLSPRRWTVFVSYLFIYLFIFLRILSKWEMIALKAQARINMITDTGVRALVVECLPWTEAKWVTEASTSSVSVVNDETCIRKQSSDVQLLRWIFDLEKMKRSNIRPALFIHAFIRGS